MWLKPGYQPEPATKAPEDTGERLLTLPRGEGIEMRVSRNTYQGRPYLALRVWERGRDGEWWPTKTGCSIRMHELPELLATLSTLTAAPSSSAPLDPSGETKYIEPRGRRQAAQRSLPTAPPFTPSSTTGEPFDEFQP